LVKKQVVKILWPSCIDELESIVNCHDYQMEKWNLSYAWEPGSTDESILLKKGEVTLATGRIP